MASKAGGAYYLTESLLCNEATRLEADRETKEAVKLVVAGADNGGNGPSSSASVPTPASANQQENERLRAKVAELEKVIKTLKRKRS